MSSPSFHQHTPIICGRLSSVASSHLLAANLPPLRGEFLPEPTCKHHTSAIVLEVCRGCVAPSPELLSNTVMFTAFSDAANKSLMITACVCLAFFHPQPPGNHRDTFPEVRGHARAVCHHILFTDLWLQQSGLLQHPLWPWPSLNMLIWKAQRRPCKLNPILSTQLPSRGRYVTKGTKSLLKCRTNWGKAC